MTSSAIAVRRRPAVSRTAGKTALYVVLIVLALIIVLPLL